MYVCICMYVYIYLSLSIYIYIYIYALGIVDRARGMRGVSCLLQQSHVIVIVRIKEVCCQIVNRARGVQRRISTSLSLYIYIYIYVYACIHTHTYMYLTSRVSQSGAMPACALRREAGVTYISLSILYIIMYIYIYICIYNCIA